MVLKEVKHYKSKSLPSHPVPDAILYIKADGDTEVTTYITDLNGVPYLLKDDQGSTGIQTITNNDGTISVLGGDNKVLNLSSSIKSIINSALQSGSNISELVNDEGYLKTIDLPNTKSEFNSQLTDGDFLFVGDVTAYTNEEAQDAVGTILLASATIDLTYNDATPSITAAVKPNSITPTELTDNINLTDFVNNAGFENTSQLNARDVENRDRTNHTGVQTISTITNLQSTLDSKVDKSGDIMIGSLTSPSFIKSGGTSSQFLKADGSSDSNTYLTSASVKTLNNISLLGSGNINIGINVWNVKDFGALGDGVNDDTSAIQLAINTVNSIGGGVIYFPKGIYQVSGALVNGNQIGIPFGAYGSSGSIIRIKLLGEIAPNMFSDPMNGGAPPNTGVILRSTLSGSGNVIGSANSDNIMNFNHLEIENITIRVKSKTGATNIAPQATAINANKLAYLTLVSVVCDTESNRNQTVLPINTSKGIILPRTGNYVFVNIDKVLVTGYHTGIELWECASLTNVFVDGCYYGLSFNASDHAAFVSKVFISRTAVHILVRGLISFYIDHFGFESGSASWYANVFNLQELVTGAQGVIRYNRVTEAVGLNNNLFIRSNYTDSKIKVESIGYSPLVENFNNKTTSYTFESIDAEKTLTINSLTLNKVTIPQQSLFNFPVGAKLKTIQYGDGNVCITGGSDIIINSKMNYNTSAGKYSVVTATKTADNTWLLTGDLGSYTNEAELFLNATSIADPVIINAINTLVADLKSYNLFTKIKALYPFVGGTADKHSYNLIDIDAYRMSFVGTAVHDLMGYKPNGINGYGNTNFNPFLNLQQNNVHISYYGLTDIGGTAGIQMGAFDPSGKGIIFQPKFTGGQNYSLIHGNDSFSPVVTSGLHVMSRLSSASATYSRNGALVSTSNTVSVGSPNCPITIGAVNRLGTINTFSNQGFGFASIGLGLSSGEITTYNTIIQTFLTALGR